MAKVSIIAKLAMAALYNYFAEYRKRKMGIAHVKCRQLQPFFEANPLRIEPPAQSPHRMSYSEPSACGLYDEQEKELWHVLDSSRDTAKESLEHIHLHIRRSSCEVASSRRIQSAIRNIRKEVHRMDFMPLNVVPAEFLDE